MSMLFDSGQGFIKVFELSWPEPSHQLFFKDIPSDLDSSRLLHALQPLPPFISFSF
jgi:hypothetical protein